MKTSSLIGTPLDWAVAKCEGLECTEDMGLLRVKEYEDEFYVPSMKWAQGGPIIEREMIFLKPSKLSPTTSKRIAWGAHGFRENTEQKVHRHGPTPLVAAMRCYVASKLGDEVYVPDEILKGNSK